MSTTQNSPNKLKKGEDKPNQSVIYKNSLICFACYYYGKRLIFDQVNNYLRKYVRQKLFTNRRNYLISNLLWSKLFMLKNLIMIANRLYSTLKVVPLNAIFPKNFIISMEFISALLFIVLPKSIFLHCSCCDQSSYLSSCISITSSQVST